MGNTAQAILGFALAGGALVVVADYQPRLALGLTGLLLLGVVVTHYQDISSALNGFAHATGH